MTTDKQELQRLCDATNLHDSYCNGYHALPRAVKRHLSLEDMQEIWHCMVKPLLEELLAELAAVTAERDALKAQVPEGKVLVPVEASEAMLVAARDWSLEKYGKPIGNDAARGCWGAMLNASKGE